jgi:hypothetical protein
MGDHENDLEEEVMGKVKANTCNEKKSRDAGR